MKDSSLISQKQFCGERKNLILNCAKKIRNLLAQENINLKDQNFQNAVFELNKLILNSIIVLEDKNKKSKLEIQPLWVETYFATPFLIDNEYCKHCDGSIAQSYENVIHLNGNGNRSSRFDVCFGDKDVCLSVLIKYYIIKDYSYDNKRPYQNDIFTVFKTNNFLKPFLTKIDYQTSFNYLNEKILTCCSKGFEHLRNYKFAAHYQRYIDIFKNR